MCGRYTYTVNPDEVAFAFGLAEVPTDLTPRYNVAPSQFVSVVGLKSDGVRRGLTRMRWGFVPRWASDPNSGPKPINAKAETLTENMAFRQSIRDRRCLIPCDGFYEWERLPDGSKRPFHFRPTVRPVAFAGVWDVWKAPNAEPLYTCAVITVPANAVVSRLHARMPALLSAERFAGWLDTTASLSNVLELLQPFPEAALEAIAVGPAVNRAKNDRPECMSPADSPSGPTRGMFND